MLYFRKDNGIFSEIIRFYDDGFYEYYLFLSTDYYGVDISSEMIKNARQKGIDFICSCKK